MAIGTQVILEKAETFLGVNGSLNNQDLNLETIDQNSFLNNRVDHRSISKYSNQPRSFTAGTQLAYDDLRQNFRSTAQTILAVPLEVFNEGSGQAVIKAIPIAFIHPFVGATSAISKTLLGLQNSLALDLPDLVDDKYK